MSTTFRFAFAFALSVAFVTTSLALNDAVDAARWTARPAFFATKSSADRCKALQIWITSMKEQVQNPNREVDMSTISMDGLWTLSAPAFPYVFGKEFAAVTPAERKEIARDLKRCFKEPWVVFFARVFEKPPGVGDARVLEKIFAQQAAKPKKIYLQGTREEGLASIEKNRLLAYQIKGSELLAKTPLYALYLQGCTNNQASVSIVFSLKTTERLANSPEYWARFENEMLPLIRRRCKAGTVQIFHHVEGFYLDWRVSKLEDVANTQREIGPSAVLSSATYSQSTRPDKHTWTYGDPVLAHYGINFDAPNASIDRIRVLADQATYKRNAAAIEKEKRDAFLSSYVESRSRLAQDLVRNYDSMKARRSEQRTSAGRLLALAKNGAPAKYSFSGYRHADVLDGIYTGRFVEMRPVIVPLAALADWKLAGGEVRRDMTVKLAYLAYHQAFAGRCADPELPFQLVTIAYDTVSFRDKGTTKTETFRIRGKPYTHQLREPFVEKFKEIDAHFLTGTSLEIAIRNLGFSSIEISRTLKEDFNKFLLEAGCGSPAVRQFEINLHLFSMDMLSLQDLRG